MWFCQFGILSSKGSKRSKICKRWKLNTKLSKKPTVIKEQLWQFYSYSFMRNLPKQFRQERKASPLKEILRKMLSVNITKKVLDDKRLKTKEAAATFPLWKTTLLRILHQHFGMNKISASRWVLKLLSNRIIFLSQFSV